MKRPSSACFLLDEPPNAFRFITNLLCSRPKDAAFVAVSSLVIAFVVLNSGWFIFAPDQAADFLVFATGTHNGSTTTSSGGSGSVNVFVNRTKPSPSLSGDCDVSRGNWVPDFVPPLYTNETCRYMRAGHNCIKNGKLDMGYLNWKWKPNDCELVRFDAALFLNLMRGKKLVFIGDSIARNHMQALLCALAQVETPRNVFHEKKNDQFRWDFPTSNFTLTNLWSPFLVNDTVEDNIYKIHLDIPADVWSSQLALYDMAVISTGYWYFRPSIYYVNGTMLGVNTNTGRNVSAVAILPALRIALQNVLKYLMNEYRGITIVRTVTVAHFEYGSWSNGGLCNRTQPFNASDMKTLPWTNEKMNAIQVEEFEKALANQKGPNKLKLMNVTYSASLRPDGHPGSSFGTPNDCLHWCMPGPIDMWNQLLLHSLLHENSTTF